MIHTYVYQGYDAGGDESVYVQKFNSDGTTFGSQVKLEATGITSGPDTKPQIIGFK